MNTPPPNYQPNPYSGPPPGPSPYGAPPPGQNPYGAPPQPPKNSANSCLLAAGITCGVLLLLTVVGIGLIGVAVKNSASNPNSFWGKSMQAAGASVQGKQIAAQVVSYKNATGSYPNSLDDLLNKGYVTQSMLHTTVDPNPDPTHVSWNYTPPNGTNANPVILTSRDPVDITLGGQTVHEQVIVYLDGMSTTVPIQPNGSPGVAPQ